MLLYWKLVVCGKTVTQDPNGSPGTRADPWQLDGDETDGVARLDWPMDCANACDSTSSCSSRGSGTEGCACEEGYGGMHCELNASHCNDMGVISALGSDAAVADPPCSCDEGRNGARCEVRGVPMVS